MQVRDGSGLLLGFAAYDEATLTLTWISERELPRGALLTVEVSDAVRGANGNSLPAGLTWSFRVRAGVTAMPVTIKSEVVTSIYKVYVVRWRAGETVDVPVPLGTFQSPWNMLFAAAVADIGRAVVSYTTNNPVDLIGVRIE